MRASVWHCLWMSFACFGVSGTAHGQQAGGLSTSQSAPPKPQAYLRFDAPLYKPGDCARLSLTMLEASAVAGGAPLTVEVAVTDRGRATGRISLSMRSAGQRRYASTACVHLVGTQPSAGSRSLRVRPGSVLGALAREAQGGILAAALAVVPAKSAGKIRFSVGARPPRVTRVETAPVDELADAQGRSIRFVRDHVIVLERDRSELARFLARRHGEIVASLGRHHLVKVDPRTADPAHLEPLAELLGGTPGRYRFSSPTALRMGVLVLEELAGGLAISLNVLTHADVQPQTAEQGGKSQFAATWFTPNSSNVNLAEGMALASLFLAPSTPDITVAFIDRGFAGPDDFSPPKPGVVRDYGADPSSSMADIPDCNVGLTSTRCSWMTLKAEATGPTSELDAPWHGGQVASVALSAWNDGQSVGGVAFPVARPYLIRSADDDFSMASAIARSLPAVSGPTTRIISMSMGSDCTVDLGLFSIDTCDAVQDGLASGVACFLLQIMFPPLSAIPCADIAALITLGEALNAVSGPVKDAEARGVLLVATASDDTSADANDARTVPCTLRNVICVGGIDTGLKRLGAKGSSISIYAPAIGVRTMQLPNQPPGTTITGVGTSFAAPIVSGALALALSINPLLTTDEARTLLRDSACRSANPRRQDGSMCAPSTDAEVDKVGYIDLLELVRLARRSAGKNPLLACTGGWDGEEANDASDDFKSAISLPTLKPAIHGLSEYKSVKPDLSIHKIRTTPSATSDEDWYKVSFGPTASGSPEGFVAKFGLHVDDPSLGILFVELWRSNACGGPPIRVVPADVMQEANSQSGAGEASVTARVRSDLSYFMRVFGGIQVSGLRVYGGNCYNKVRAEVMDIGAVPLLPPQEANCP
ncbi:MAG TPA: S8/S53 family peptidase [Casimicrobiaceae bacterium]|nr:S8/S53 family peptidase [Casimicrobiaceae bacterium]